MSLICQTRYAVSRYRSILAIFGTALIGSCVTVNVPIVFPESSVQKATDDFVREIYRAKEKGKTPAATDPASLKKNKDPQKTQFDLFFMNSAYAIEAVFKVDSEKAVKIQHSL
ncbi:MAG: hypothetical protein AABZ55_01245, partial [Bdellovibrionota bacterium]